MLQLARKLFDPGDGEFDEIQPSPESLDLVNEQYRRLVPLAALATLLRGPGDDEPLLPEDDAAPTPKQQFIVYPRNAYVHLVADGLAWSRFDGQGRKTACGKDFSLWGTSRTTILPLELPGGRLVNRCTRCCDADAWITFAEESSATGDE